MFNNPLNKKYQTGGSVEDEGFYSWLKSNVKEFKDYSIERNPTKNTRNQNLLKSLNLQMVVKCNRLFANMLVVEA